VLVKNEDEMKKKKKKTLDDVYKVKLKAFSRLKKIEGNSVVDEETSLIYSLFEYVLSVACIVLRPLRNCIT